MTCIVWLWLKKKTDVDLPYRIPFCYDYLRSCFGIFMWNATAAYNWPYILAYVHIFWLSTSTSKVTRTITIKVIVKKVHVRVLEDDITTTWLVRPICLSEFGIKCGRRRVWEEEGLVIITAMLLEQLACTSCGTCWGERSWYGFALSAEILVTIININIKCPRDCL